MPDQDGIPASVRAMVDDPRTPTAPLDDFLVAMKLDDNWWWRIEAGHHLNLFEAACERIPEVDLERLNAAILAKVTAMPKAGFADDQWLAVVVATVVADTSFVVSGAVPIERYEER